MPYSTAILIDNMYIQHAQHALGIGILDPRKYPDMLLRDDEKHYKTYIFDALPYVPKKGATQKQRERRKKKRGYLDALQYYERIMVETGYVEGKATKCPKCKNSFSVPVQKQVDVKLSVRLVQLAWEKVIEKIVLVTGDGDIMPAVNAVEASGTIVRLAYVVTGDVKTNKGLIKCCPEKHKLTKKDFEKAIYKKE